MANESGGFTAAGPQRHDIAASEGYAGAVLRKGERVSKGRILKGAAAGWLVFALSACATTGSPTKWAPREGANLAADKAACLQETREVDMKSAAGYSDARYGVAAAMAGRMDGADMTGGGVDRLYNAIEDACMKRKGWTPAQ